MREFLKGLELDSELIDTIMAEHGKLVTRDKEAIQDLRSELQNLKESSSNVVELQEKYDELSKRVADEEAKAKDEELNNTIIEAIGDKKFVNDYTKNSIINEVKTALQDEANVGKSTMDLFNEITKDKTGLFTSPNQMVDMAGVDENIDGAISKDTFDKMGYKERLALKQENPELFNKYNNS